MANGIFLATRVKQQRERERRGFAQDIANLQQFTQSQRQRQATEQRLAILQALPLAQRQAFQGQAPQFPPVTPFPTAQSTAGGQLFGDFLLGQQRQQGALQRVQAKPNIPKQSSSVILDPADSSKAIRVRNTFDAQGNITNQVKIGDATLAEAIGGVAAEGLQKGTQTKLEKDVIDLQGTLTELGAIEKQFNEDFFTFRGKGRAFFTALGEKAEIPVGKAATQFLKRRTKFFADSKRVFLKFRKFITGVAGGIEEFKEIAKATIDPEKDSPTQFRAKLESMRDNAIRTSNLLLALKNSGLQPTKANIKAAVSLTPLTSIPLEISPDVNLQTLGAGQSERTIRTPESQAASDEEIIRILQGSR